MSARVRVILSAMHRLGLGLLCAVVLNSGAAAQAPPPNCPGLQRFSDTAAKAAYLLADPMGRFSRSQVAALHDLIERVEKKTLRRALDARFRSLDYTLVMSTLAELQQLAEVSLASGRNEFRRGARPPKLVRRVAEMRGILRGLCANVQPGRSPSQVGQDQNTTSTARLVSRALEKADVQKGGTTLRSHSTLFWIYVAMATMVAVILVAPFVISKIYALLLRRARCRIPSRLAARSREFRGEVVRMSLRGLDFKVQPKDMQLWEGIAEQGDAVLLKVEGRNIRVTVSYMPEPETAIIGLRIVRELEPEELREILKHSLTPPVRDGRRSRRRAP